VSIFIKARFVFTGHQSLFVREEGATLDPERSIHPSIEPKDSIISLASCVDDERSGPRPSVSPLPQGFASYYSGPTGWTTSVRKETVPVGSHPLSNPWKLGGARRPILGAKSSLGGWYGAGDV
jgi:hypothetical protein